jgi:outer membrane protein OmpA-like peptidoglycan-associated protein
MAQSLGLRKRASWWLGLLGLLIGVLLFLLFMKERRPKSASRETTTTGAEVRPHAGAEVIGAAGPACASHTSCAAEQLCTRGHCEPITARTTECRDAMIRFASGATELSSSAELAVERAARCLKANRTPQLAIEPSNDPNLSKQGNERLTETRRSNVRHALEQRGITSERLTEIGLP